MEKSNILLTRNSGGDDWLKQHLDQLLWGYPELVEACPLIDLAEARKQNLEEEWEKINDPHTSDVEQSQDVGELPHDI